MEFCDKRKPFKTGYLCSIHFKETDFTLLKIGLDESNKYKMKKDAIPSIKFKEVSANLQNAELFEDYDSLIVYEGDGNEDYEIIIEEIENSCLTNSSENPKPKENSHDPNTNCQINVSKIVQTEDAINLYIPDEYFKRIPTKINIINASTLENAENDAQNCIEFNASEIIVDGETSNFVQEEDTQNVHQSEELQHLQLDDLDLDFHDLPENEKTFEMEFLDEIDTENFVEFAESLEKGNVETKTSKLPVNLLDRIKNLEKINELFATGNLNENLTSHVHSATARAQRPVERDEPLKKVPPKPKMVLYPPNSKINQNSRPILELCESFQCSICLKFFHGNTEFNKHMKTHQLVEKRFNCDTSGCEKKFSTEKQLEKHKYLLHTEGLLSCSDCAKVFESRNQLFMHMRIHSRNKRYFCDFCGKNFVNKHYLENHLRVHTGEFNL